MSNPDDIPMSLDHAQKSPCASSTGGAGEKRHRLRRLRLSCKECRVKKLSCDRRLPCHRCVRSGRPQQCSFESGVRPLPVSNDVNHDQLRDLQFEVAQLKAMLSKTGPQYQASSGDSIAETRQNTDTAGSGMIVLPDEGLQSPAPPAHVINTEPLQPKERSPQGYYGQHTLFQLFDEIPQLFPFIQEIVDEWFKPRGVSLRKPKVLQGALHREASPLEKLLPPKNHTDVLVSFYLNHLEHVHRIVHIPAFRREYANFWVPERARYPAMTVLVLAMISISTCATTHSPELISITSAHREMPPKWIAACDEWLIQQSSKGRKLVYYQVSCLIYLAKRMNTIRKKRFWNETGSLIHYAILDRLHHEPSPNLDSAYMREMKRRIWAVLREFDLQNTIEYQLPSLLHNIDSNVTAPTNIDDEGFNETSIELPTQKPLDQYTSSSYQAHSFRSWKLRLEISRHLYSSALPKALGYGDVLRYTHELTRALDSLPHCTGREASSGTGSKTSALVSAYLQFQLKDYILAIHRPYLQRGNGTFSLSEIICFQTSRDILLLNKELAGLGIQDLTLLREDLLVASLSLIHITMLQPRGSTSIIATSSESTIELLEHCLPFMENRYLRCFFGEPWCPLTMCGAMMLLKIHLGKETRHTAKTSCAQRFLGLYYQHFARPQPSLLHQQYPTPAEANSNMSDSYLQLPISDTAIPSESEWLDSRYPDLGVEPFDLDMDWDGAWGLSWSSLPNQSLSFEETIGTLDGASAAVDML